MVNNRYLDGLSLLLTKWPIGLLPGKLQERIARRYGRDSYSYFYAELIGSTCVSMVIYGSGQLIESPDSDFLKYIDEAATIYTLFGRVIPTSVRYLLSRAIKRPVGSCAVEAASILLERISETRTVKKGLERIVDIKDKLRNVA